MNSIRLLRFLVLLLPVAASAADFTSTWNGSINTNWSVGGNWTTPGATGIFPNNGTSTYDAVQNAGVLTVNQDITIQKFTFSGTATNTGAGFALTTNDALTLTGFKMDGSGAIYALGGGSIGTLEIHGRTLNYGDGAGPVQTTNWITADVTLANGAIINNRIDSNFNVAVAGKQLANIRGGTATFNNQGTFTKNDGAGTATVASGAYNFNFNNSGTVDVGAGKLIIGAGTGSSTHTNTGTFQIASGATLELGSNHTLSTNSLFTGAGTAKFVGTVTASAATTVNSNLAIEGELTGSSPVTVNGTFALQGGAGSLSGANVTALGDVTMTMGNGSRIKNGAVLNLGDGAGPDTGSTTTWPSGGIALEQGGTINNRSDSVINATANNSMSSTFNGTSVTFNNEGTFNQNGTGTTTIGGNTNAFVFQNSGLVQVNSGTLNISVPTGTNTGTFAVASGATLTISNNYTLNAGSSFTGSGTVNFNGPDNLTNVVTANVAVTVDPNLNLGQFGKLSGPGLVTVNGNLNLAGFMEGAKITALGDVVINASTREINSSTLTLGDGAGPDAGSTTTWSVGDIFMRNPSTINNRSDSVINATANNSISAPNGGTFNNEGTFNQNGTLTTTFGAAMNNSGIINVNNGTLLFNGTYTQTAGALVLNGGNVSRGSSSNTFTVQGGKLQGGGTVTGGVTASGGNIHIEPGIGTTPGTLTITGDLTLTSGSKLSFDIGGTTAGTQHDQIIEGGTTALNLAGSTLEVTLLGTFIPTPANTFILVDSNQNLASSTLKRADGTTIVNGGRIGTTDGKGTFQVNYTSDIVFLSNFQTTPTGIMVGGNSSTGQIVENAPDPKNVGLLGATDPNPAATFTFTLVSGTGSTDNALFQISGNQLQAKSSTVLDFEAKTSYSIRLRVTNNSGGFFEQAFTIQVQDVPSPTALALSANSFPENQAVGHIIGALSATNPPGGGDPATFSVVSVNGSTTAPLAFAVSSGNLVTNRAFDFETAPNSFNVVVQATNQGGESAQQAFTVTVTNEGVTDFALSPGSVQENRPADTSVGTLSSTVTPLGTAVTYALVSGAGSTDNALFAVNGSTLETAAVLDFEAAATRSIRVKATDANGEVFEKALVVTVTDVAAPTDIALSASSIAENQPVNTVIGVLSAIDPDPGAVFTFTLVDAANFPDNVRFNISGSSLRSSQSFDKEAVAPEDRGPFNIRVRVTNGANEFFEETLAITLTDQGPTALALSPSTVLEGKANITVGALSAATIIPAGTAISTWELVAGAADNALFTLDGTTLKTGATALDFETAATRTVRVKATDANGETFAQDLTVNVADVSITDITLSSTTVLENLPAGTVIANLAAILSPADPAATPAFSIVSATPNDAVTISGSQLITARPIRRSVTPSIAVRLSAQHIGESFEKDVTITVNANAASLSITPLESGGTLPFGDVVFGSGATSTRTVNLTNSGPGHVFNIRTITPGLPDYVITSPALVANDDLAPGESAEVTITFTPQGLGLRNTLLGFTSDNANSVCTATGRGIGAEISVQHPLGTELVDGATLDFGRQPLGVNFPARTFIVTNVGSVTSLGSVAATITGPDAAAFVLVTQGLTTTLPAGASNSLSVTFRPDALRTYSATLRITSTDADENPFDIPLTGEGVTPLMIAQTAYAKASDTSASSIFGRAVAVSGNTVVVGAANAPGGGAVYVFVRDALTGVWTQEGAPLKGLNTGPGDGFGVSVAISGDSMVVGASGEDSAATGVNGDGGNSPGFESAGAAYVFQRSGGVWAQQAYLKASNTDASDFFGNAVAIAGDTIVVGAFGDDSAATGVNGDGGNSPGIESAGAAYVFQRTAGVWTQQAYLKASNTDGIDLFGYSVGISGDTIVVGSFGEQSGAIGVNGDGSNTPGFEYAGAAYVFQRSGGAWTQQAYLKASNTNGGDIFGISVAISGDTIVVGAFAEDSAAMGVNGDANNNRGGNTGAAYVYQRSGVVWSQQAYLKASNTGLAGTSQFGYAVSISNESLVVGAVGESSPEVGINGDGIGNAVGVNSGAAYVFQRSGGAWSQQAYLKASNTGQGDFFGLSVAIGDNLVVAGASNEDSAARGINGNGGDNTATQNSGAAYIFEVTSPQVIIAHEGGETGYERLADNQAQAVDYGPTPLGISVTHSFTINNVRALPLTVSNIDVPDGYEVLGAPTEPIPAQGTATFSVQLDALTLGTNSGNVTITTNDSANPVFEFPVTGEVLSIPVGSFDPRFGTNGVVRVDFGNSDFAFDMLRLDDGRIVLAGENFDSDAGTGRFALACLKSDGALDASFGNGGKVLTDVPELGAARITGICLQGHNIVAAGTRRNSGGLDQVSLPGFALIRYLPDGGLDPIFGVKGRVIDGDLTLGDSTGHIVVNPSNKLLLAGTQLTSSGFRRGYVRRFGSNGEVDVSFGIGGTQPLSVSGYGGAIVTNAAGDIYSAGSDTSTINHIGLWKVNDAGTSHSVQIQPYAAPGGYPTDVGGGKSEVATALALQADGKPVFSARRGSLLVPSIGHGFIVGRALSSGAKDTTFNGTGSTIEDVSPTTNSEQAFSVAVQADGKLVVAGQAGGEWVVLRYTPTGEVDLSFGTQGKVILPLGGAASAQKVLIDAEGDIYIGGYAFTTGINNYDFVVVKLIGSVTHEPSIVVRNGSTATSPVLINGQATAISYGTPRVGTSGVSKSYLINNLGNGPLTISNVTVPTGYQIVSNPSSVAAGASATLTIKLKADTLGTFSGPVTITTNDPVQSLFTFPVTGTVVANSPPSFSGLTIATVQGVPAEIAFAKILANASDANGDALSVGKLPSATSVSGATLTMTDKANILYSPPVDLIGVDTFQVEITDGVAVTLGTITVTVTQDPALNPKNPPQLTIESVTGTTAKISLTFSGLPNRTYTIQRSTNLAKWDDIGTALATRQGVINFVDNAAPLPTVFYRLKL
ncbi:MAG: choice-of-anchor D domain-containing protein [Verrucomicrobiaceae bacterium]|nr:choice-of-anchor D domain-containing protein [Verrucomicrobiaceae bacterium]